MKPKLLFLHGINAGPENLWLEPLNAAITWFGHEPFDPEDVISPDYRSVLRGSVQNPPPTPRTWKAPSAHDARQALTKHLASTANLESRLRPFANGQTPPLAPPTVADVPPVVELLKDARRYSTEREIRDGVHHVVLGALSKLPKGSQLVILAHSLGSVVAADILMKLPTTVQVPVLITIGSPLGAIAALNRNCGLERFPCDRVSAWVNVFEPRDLVTGARGITRFHPEAIDLPVALKDWAMPFVFGQHGAQYYCTHPTVAAAITGGLYGTAIQPASTGPDLSVEGLELPLLQSVYLRELVKQLPTKEHDRVARLERARVVTAARHSAASADLHARQATTSFLEPEKFLRSPDLLIRGVWDDRTLLALAIMLASGPPAPPFQTEENPDDGTRRMALLATVNLVRSASHEPSDVAIVDALYDSKAEVDGYLGEGRPWLPFALAGAGLAVLAATGIGLAVAVPAGLAGAALITSTLATFGPGGMIGGMATLAALAGAGSAMAAAGAAFGVAIPSGHSVDLFGQVLDEAIGANDADALRSLLAALLTMAGAQERLEWPTQRDSMLVACLNAHARTDRLVAEHKSIDPKSQATKAAEEMLGVLEKACNWLRGSFKPSTPDAKELAATTDAFRLAMEGDDAAFVGAVHRPVRGGPEPLAIAQ